MDDTLIPLAVGILGFKVIGLAASILLHRGHQTTLTRMSVGYWTCLMIAFFWSASAPESRWMALIGVSIWTPSWYFMEQIVACVLSKPAQLLQRFLIVVFCQIVATVTFAWRHDFTTAALIAVLPFVFFYTDLAWRVFRSTPKSQPEVTLLAISLLLCSIHVLDYPWLRFSETYAALGFVVAYLIEGSQLVGVMTTITGHIRIAYTQNLEREIALATTHLKSAEAWKTKLLRVICHDIANGLAGLQLYQHKLAQQCAGTPAAATVESCRIVSQSQISLLDNIRTIMLFSSGKLRLQKKKIELIAATRHSLTLLDGPIKHKQISISFDHPDQPCWILADESLLIHSILNNILSNAIKFSDRGESISVSVSQGRVSIKDTGIGIEAHRLEHLTSESHPTSTQGTQGESGSGFGMLIVHELTQLIDAKLTIESVPRSESPDQSGTTITIFFQTPEFLPITNGVDRLP